MPDALANRVLGSASKLNRDVRFLDGLQCRGREQAERFLGAPAFERAVVEGDEDALRAATTEDAVLDAATPFHPRSGVPLRAHLSTVLAGGAHIDPTRKQIAADRAAWPLRLPDGFGHAGAVVTGGRVSGLRLGPVP